MRGDDAKPTHGKIRRNGNYREAVSEPKFEQNANHGHAPDDGKKRPTPTAAQIDEEKRRVRAGDEQVNCAVVENHEGALGTRRGGAVIESGGRIEAHERRAKNSAAEDLPHATAHNCENQKNDEADDAADQAEAVRERVGKFVGGDVVDDSAGPGEHAFRSE